MNSTLLTIVIPTYNYAHTLARAVNSVLSQMSESIELIIINDGSTDNTDEVITRIQQLNRHQFIYVKQVNKGVAAARNYGIKLAKGNYLLFLDADDELKPKAVSIYLDQIQKAQAATFFIFAHTTVEENGTSHESRPIKLAAVPKENLVKYLIQKKISLANGATLFPKRIFNYGQYPEQITGGEDIPIFSQALINLNSVYVPISPVNIHKHSDSLRHNAELQNKSVMELVNEVFSVQRGTLFDDKLRKKYIALRYLSLARINFRNKQYRLAKSSYINALKANYYVIFKASYTLKFIKSLLFLIIKQITSLASKNS